MSKHPRTNFNRPIALATAFAIALILICALPRSAHAVYRYADYFGSSADFSGPNGIDISSSTGYIYVRNNGGNIQVFDPQYQKVNTYGTSLGIGAVFNVNRAQGIAVVDASTQWISNDTVARRFVNGFESTGITGINQVQDTAISNSGKLYVLRQASGGQDYILRYSLSAPSFFASPELSFGPHGSGDGELDNASGIAVSATNDVYVVDKGNHRVQKFDADGNYLLQFGTQGTENGQFTSPTQIAVSLTNGDVYVVDEVNNRVEIFDSDGVYKDKFTWINGSGPGQFQPSDIGYFIGGIALSTSSDKIFLVDTANNRIQTFADLPAIAPTVQTEAATAIHSKGAKLSASWLDNGAAITQYGFAYGLTSDLTGPSVSTSTLGTISSTFEQTLSGLTPNTRYYYRAYAENSFGRTHGSIASFRTYSSDVYLTPLVITEDEGGSTSFSATLLFEPTDDVVIHFSTSTSGLGSGFYIGETTLTFTPGDWDTPQIVSVDLEDDSIYTGNRDGLISSTLVSADANYNNKNNDSIVLHINDDETNLISLPSTDFDIDEGGHATTTFTLLSAPTDDVTLTFSASTATSGSGVVLSTSSLTFTSSNWSVPQELDISAINDAIYSSDRTVIVSTTATSNDPAFDGFFVPDINVSIAEDDASSSPSQSSGSGSAGTAGGQSGGGYVTVQMASPNAATSTSSTNPDGCLSGFAFNILTGKKCPVSVPVLPSFAFDNDLQSGATHPDVKKLQAFLNSVGILVARTGAGSPGRETSYFGPATRAALARFQAANGIVPASGYFGPITRGLINRVSGAVTQPSHAISGVDANPFRPAATIAQAKQISSPLSLGAAGASVKILRTKLRLLGYFASYGSVSDVPASAAEETDYFGTATEEAVKKFQCDKLIVCTGTAATTGWGTVGPKTRAALGM